MSARILIVEDEEPLTMLLRYNLEAKGYEVDTAARGDELRRYTASEPDFRRAWGGAEGEKQGRFRHRSS